MRTQLSLNLDQSLKSRPIRTMGSLPMTKTQKGRSIAGVGGQVCQSFGPVTLPIPLAGLGYAAEINYVVTGNDQVTLLSYRDVTDLGFTLDMKNE